uniref:Uncharacterized protein n=1 Tax=Hordeum vulgare subsp. vulgare TaxID=112509 RepID=A0A8I6WWR7_HORVV
MALRQLCVCILFMPLLLAVTFAGRPSMPPQTATMLARDGCHKTVMSVPKWCAGQFIQGLFTGNRNVITEYCCVQLTCVGEPTCASVLHGICPPPKTYVPCPPHQGGGVDDRHT